MSQQIWCEHIPDNHFAECWGMKWMFCPICGTSRPPKEMSLAEKFRGKFKLLDEYFDNACEELAKIADEHHRGAK